MQPFSNRRGWRLKINKKIVVFLLLSIFITSAILVPTKPAQAQWVVTDITQKIRNIFKDLWQKGGSLAFQQTLSTVLNKMAYDAANYLGSGARGQAPLFMTKDWGQGLLDIGDEAAGTFLENFAANFAQSGSESQCLRSYETCSSRCGSSETCYSNCATKFTECNAEVGSGTEKFTVNFCQPSSLDVKVKIGLSLAEQVRPRAPACTATKMISNWTSAAQKYADYSKQEFLDDFVDVFNPSSGDLGVYYQGKSVMGQKVVTAVNNFQTKLLGQGGWLDVKDAAGNPISLPSQGELQAKGAYDNYASNFGKYTGDAFVDAGRLFLNQAAITAFNTLMKELGKKTPASSPSAVGRFEADPSSAVGETALKAATIKLLQPNLGVRADYNILSEMMMCPDRNNPGPTNCVIDSKFMQAISEQKTVSEALKDGYLNGNWQFSIEGGPGSFENNYSWRNISILRKYRIVPASWEAVFEKMERIAAQAEKEPSKFQPKKATLMDLVSCFSPYDEFNQFSAQFDATDQAWCTGMVDPYWVLKAPLNLCQKQGVSSQIINRFVTPSQPAFGTNPYIPSELNILRAENYCADQQTCIKEGKDGDCLAYGYCNEEKRTWTFEGDSCAPVDNTCQTFVNSGSKQRVSYLENTLDFEGCSPDNAGCQQYSNVGNYDVQTGTVAWNPSASLYFNNKIANCSSGEEGCSELIRVKPAWGANLVMNASFINDQVGDEVSSGGMLNDWPVIANRASIVNAASDPGGNSGAALKLEGSFVSVYSNQANSLVPENLDLIAGQAYTVSADVYLQGTKVAISLGGGQNSPSYESQTANTWHHISISRVVGPDFTGPNFAITGEGGTLYVKNIKFEMSGWDTGFSSYGATKSYQKVLPQYLESACYLGNTAGGFSYQLKPGALEACSKDFARRCDRNEAGCELYRSNKNSFAVPAQVSNADYCPSECVGYDIYVARETHFNSAQAENMIPATANKCSASSAGCNEFTNLDDLATGGENREYYSALKHCAKPGQATCGSFYAWEGTSTGYQLRVYSLEMNANGRGPRTIADDSQFCNATIYNADPSNPIFNPSCREFYDAAGAVFYHLDSHVITCSDACRAYRMTEKNYDRSLSQGACVGRDKSWDVQEGACVSCLNGGTWSSEHRACVYQGIPGEGKVCSAQENGCREYNGNTGNNVRLISSYDFEAPSSAWTSNCNSGISLSNISSSRDGKSLFYNNSAGSCSPIGRDTQALASHQPLIKQIMATDAHAAQLKVGTSVTKGRAYNVKFWANAPAGANLKIYFYNPDIDNQGEATAAFNNGATVNIKAGGWQIYSANLESLDHNVSPNEILAISANGDFYLDNFILTEITDRYYLIKGSSRIPNICYYDINDTYQGADYNLGCAAYTDRAGVNHNLHSFSNICDESSVGCEQVISTNNYSAYGGGIWQDENENGSCDVDEPDCVKIEKDAAMYLVFDRSKQCNSADVGCTRLGQAQPGTGATAWSDVFKQNNPNRYDQDGQILCGADALGCDAWQIVNGSGFSYFRNPGADFCVYRQGSSQAGGQKAWYKAPVKRCDRNASGAIEGSETQGAVCNSNDDCGGSNCIVDSNDYPCDYTYFSTIGYGGAGNRVPVPTANVGLCEAKSSGCREYIDPVSRFNPNLVVSGTNYALVQPNKLYLLTWTTPGQVTLTATTTSIFPLANDNQLSAGVNSVQVSSTSPVAIFHSGNNTRVSVTNAANAVLRELAIEYQLADTVDKSSCNGLADFNNGCVLFNERAIVGATGYASLANGFDPYNTKDGATPSTCSGANCTANKLIKVRPNRVCASWLDCATYSYDENGKRTCYSLKQCNSLNEAGECNNFLPDEYKPAAENATGYYFVNKYSVSQMSEKGLNSLAHYDFEELIPPLACTRLVNPGQPCSFDRNIVKDLIVREPDKARVDYPASGKSYLRVPAAYSVSPHAPGDFINLAAGQTYYLSYLLNTKNANSDAEVIIAATSPDNLGASGRFSFTASSTSGWTRKINTFTMPSVNEEIKAVILLRSKAGTNQAQAGEIYFDDINIEPVLEIGVNQYAARECRLYPDNSSLSCKQQNKDVIKEGLEGYCLEYDRDNKNICQTWYPVDRISSSLFGGTSLGYNGQLGLNYCTQIKADILFAKKVKAQRLYYNRDESSDGKHGVIDTNVTSCTELPSGPATGHRYCEYHCGNCENYRAIVVNKKLNDNHEQVFCVPNENSTNKLLMIGEMVQANIFAADGGSADSCEKITFYESAWMKYDGTFLQQPSVLCEGGEGYRCSPINESTNADPPIRIYDKAYPPADEQGLKLLASDAANRDKVFNFTCNQFTQVVSSSGDNKAWAVRTGIESNPEHAFTTPSYFNLATQGYGAQLYQYGRQRNGVPFGAATFGPDYDLLNSGPVYLQNQYYQKEKETIFAGRPYGCTGESCANVGYCSDNNNVICVYYQPGPDGSTYINDKTCSDGGFGRCVPLWRNGENISAASVLSTIFAQSYGSFQYQHGGYVPATSTSVRLTRTAGVRPVITPISFTRGDENIANYRATRPGLYTLKFTTNVNPEQQPLRMIFINWGDGSQQAFTGQDHRPDSSNPHVFHHYYSQATTSPIQIRVWDNWDMTQMVVR